MFGGVDAGGLAVRCRAVAEVVAEGQAGEGGRAASGGVDLGTLGAQPVGQVEVGVGAVVGGQQLARRRIRWYAPGAGASADRILGDLLAARTKYPACVGCEALDGAKLQLNERAILWPRACPRRRRCSRSRWWCR